MLHNRTKSRYRKSVKRLSFPRNLILLSERIVIYFLDIYIDENFTIYIQNSLFILLCLQTERNLMKKTVGFLKDNKNVFLTFFQKLILEDIL